MHSYPLNRYFLIILELVDLQLSQVIECVRFDRLVFFEQVGVLDAHVLVAEDFICHLEQREVELEAFERLIVPERAIII